MTRTRRAGAVALATAGLCLTTLAPLGAQATAASSDTNDATLQFQRGQSFVALDPGASGSFDAACPAGYHAVNGGFQLDGGSTHNSRDTFVVASWALAGVDVDAGAAVDSREVWRVEVQNDSEERITGRVNAVCLGGTTEGADQHPISVTDTGWTATTIAEDGNGYFTQASGSCGDGIAVGSMYRVAKPALQVAATTSGAAWTLVFESYAATNQLWVSSRCLATTTGTVGGHQTLVQAVTPDPLSKSASIADAASAEINAVCPAGSLAMAAEFYGSGGGKSPVESGVVPLGGEPRSETASHRFYNDSGAAADVTTAAVCVEGVDVPEAEQVVTTGATVVNGRKVTIPVSCSLGCGALTGKLFLMDGSDLGPQIAYGKLVLGNATSGSLKLRFRGNYILHNFWDYTLVLSGRDFSGERFDVDAP